MGNVIEVVVSNESGLAQEIRSGRHVWYSDEPQPFGTDNGPSPYELLLSSLGACTSMTLRLYAARKQWDLQKVTVRLKHSRVHPEDCMDCETKPSLLDRIERDIEIGGNLDAAQKDRLLEIAERCPVHRTLQSKIDIQTRLKLKS
jgi:putative redox protein